MKRFWVSWEHVVGGPAFELRWPWWVSGETFSGDKQMVCAAIVAANEDAARTVIRKSYDRRPRKLEWRFVNERPDDWLPYNDRFPRAKWMRKLPAPFGWKAA